MTNEDSMATKGFMAAECFETADNLELSDLYSKNSTFKQVRSKCSRRSNRGLNFFERLNTVAASLFFVSILSTISVFAIGPTKKVIQADQSDGLVRIDKDGGYIYDEKKSLKDSASHIRLGQANQPQIELDIDGEIFNFEDFYGSSTGLTVGYDYEKFIARGAGRLGWQVGLAVQYAQGKGRLLQSPNPSLESYESFTFFTIPLYAGAVYRLEFSERQFAVPYASGGGTVIGLLEKREDKNTPNATSGFGFYAAGGLLVNISAFDRETALTLDSEYGVGNLWVNLEFKLIEASGAAFTYQNSYLQGGISFDF